MTRKEVTEQPSPLVEPSLLERLTAFERWRSGDRSGGPPPDPESPVVPGRSWATTGQDHIVLPKAWRTDVPQKKRRRIRIRWSFVFSLLLIAAAVAAAIRFIPELDRQLADHHADAFRESVADLEIATDGAETAAAVVADATATIADLEAQIPAVSNFQTATADLGELARESLPSTPPLLPRTEIEALAPWRERLDLVAGRADFIASRLVKFLNYRASFATAFVVPPLPREATPEIVDDLSLELATMLADTLNVVTDLPADPLLDPHRSDAQEALEELRQWQVDYLQALRSGETIRAGLLARDVESRITVLRQGVVLPLVAFGTWAGQELDGLRLDIERSWALSPADTP